VVSAVACARNRERSRSAVTEEKCCSQSRPQSGPTTRSSGDRDFQLVMLLMCMSMTSLGKRADCCPFTPHRREADADGGYSQKRL
jgi:hypothetical protein